MFSPEQLQILIIAINNLNDDTTIMYPELFEHGEHYAELVTILKDEAKEHGLKTPVHWD